MDRALALRRRCSARDKCGLQDLPADRPIAFRRPTQQRFAHIGSNAINVDVQLVLATRARSIDRHVNRIARQFLLRALRDHAARSSWHQGQVDDRGSWPRFASGRLANRV
jgi:hypothetical protein